MIGTLILIGIMLLWGYVNYHAGKRVIMDKVEQLMLGLLCKEREAAQNESMSSTDIAYHQGRVDCLCDISNWEGWKE